MVEESELLIEILKEQNVVRRGKEMMPRQGGRTSGGPVDIISHCVILVHPPEFISSPSCTCGSTVVWTQAAH